MLRTPGVSRVQGGVSSAGAAHARFAEPSPSGRPLLSASAVVVTIWTAVVAWRVMTDVVAPWDSKNQFYAFFRFLASAIHSGATPFWNPYHYGGHPAVADPQSLIFAPLFFLWALFDATPSMQAFDVLVYAHLLIGALALCVFGWMRGWPAAACVLAAIMFMFGASASSRMQHTGIIVTYAMFPPSLLLLHLAMQRRSIPIALGFALTASVLALGRNQAALLLCFVLLAYAVAEILSAQAPRRYLMERVSVLATMAVTGIAVLIAPLLLTLQFAALSNRPHATLERALESSLYPATLATLAVPNVLGAHSWPPWGPNYELTPELASTDESFTYLFVGSVAVLLLLWLGLAGGRAFGRGARLFCGVAVVALLYMLGRYTPFFAWAFTYVPGIDLFRRPAGGSFVLAAALALLSGFLLADYARDGLPRLRPWRVIAAAFAVVAILVWAVAFSARTGHAWNALAAIAVMLPLPIIAAVLLIRARTMADRGRAAVVVVALAVAELVWWNGVSRLNAEGHKHYAVLDNPAGEEAVVLKKLVEAVAERRREGERPRVEIMGAGGAWQNAAMVHGLEAINGYNPLRIGVYDRLIAPGETTYLVEQRAFPASFDGYDSPLARALGLEFVLLGQPIEKVPHLKARPVAEVLHEGPRFWLYRLRHPMPRLAFVTRIQVADADGRSGELLASLSPDHALLDDDTPPQAFYGSAWPAQAGSASIANWQPGRIEIEAASPHGGLLVLHDTNYPGWVAEIDGRRVPILRADVLFRGVEVPAGARRVVFRYAPFSAENLLNVAAGLLRR